MNHINHGMEKDEKKFTVKPMVILLIEKLKKKIGNSKLHAFISGRELFDIFYMVVCCHGCLQTRKRCRDHQPMM
jgi:hypothetical protein